MPGYEVSQNADEDLLRIFEYGVEHFGIDAAMSYFDKLHIAFSKIAENPLLYATSPIRKGYRVYTLLPDTIYYRINHNVVEVMAIIRSQDDSIWVQ